MCGFPGRGGSAIAEIPKNRCLVTNKLRVIAEVDGIGEADDRGHQKVSDHHRHVEVHFDSAEVAIIAAVLGGVCARSGRE